MISSKKFFSFKNVCSRILNLSYFKNFISEFFFVKITLLEVITFKIFKHRIFSPTEKITVIQII